jgi:hypothetical protein
MERRYERSQIPLSFWFIRCIQSRVVRAIANSVRQPNRIEDAGGTILGYQPQTKVTGAPFSAIEESVYSQKQPDRTYVDRSLVTTHIYRDSQGRTRAERYEVSQISNALAKGSSTTAY